MDFEELKNILMQYGEKLDEEDLDIFEQAVKVNDGKIIVDGKPSAKHVQNIFF